ncbi:MAG: sigma-70 family RNA polymerase sigma factor [Flavobacteriales bacterium]|nr:sigma-70 family RNA polymerase sigma factor [Flavobacteriales bacterium]
MEEYSDSELLKQFQSEDSRHYAFNTLVKKHQEKLYWHIRRMVLNHDDADDILQNTWIKAWKGLAKFRADANLYTWLYRIATNETITFLNNKKKRFFIPIGDVESELASDFESDNSFTGDEIQRKLQQAILTLPEKQRLVFNMKYFDEMKYTQMAEVLDTSVGALKASYHIAVKKIEKQLLNSNK